MRNLIHRTSVLMDMRASICRYNPTISLEDLKEWTSGIDCVLDSYTDQEIEFGCQGHTFNDKEKHSVVPRIAEIIKSRG